VDAALETVLPVDILSDIRSVGAADDKGTGAGGELGASNKAGTLGVVAFTIGESM
jgi:hypothetical protein